MAAGEKGPAARRRPKSERVAGVAGFPLDDSWIHLHFARNIAEGAGFAYNPGRPVAGSTAPLWTLLLAGAAVMTNASVIMAKLVGVLCALGAAALVAHARDHTWFTATLAALAVTTRPEAALLIPFLLLSRSLTPGRVAALVLVPLAALAPLVAFSYATVG